MADGVLFEITEGHLDTGLRGYPIGRCTTSAVDPHTGVSYVGHPIADLADTEPEAVAFLLLEGRLPDAGELAAFQADLAGRRGLDSRVFGVLEALPREGHPMEWLVAGLSVLGMTSKSGDWLEDAKNAIAQAPELVAAIFRIRSGWGGPIAPTNEPGLIEDFVHMLGVPGGDPARLGRILRTFYVLHMDHGGGNLSTFTGKSVASGHADLFTSLAGAMCGLSGPLHGRANQDCLAFVREIGTSDAEAVETLLRERLASGQKIYGFGHAVLRAEDPRATIQYALGEQICGDDPLFQIVKTLREVAVRVLKELPKVSNPYPNVDAVSGSLLNASGFTEPDYYTVLFGLARMTGISAQIVHERTQARGGRGVPIYRPKYISVPRES